MEREMDGYAQEGAEEEGKAYDLVHSFTYGHKL